MRLRNQLRKQEDVAEDIMHEPGRLESQSEREEAFEMWCYRRMFKINLIWVDRITNEEKNEHCGRN